jgi:hypothetical protein
MGMGKIKLRCAATLIAAMALFSTPSVLRLGTLKEFSTPYVGEYRCETLRIGGIDLLKDFDVRLTLSGEGMLTLTWKNLFAKEQSTSLPYEYDDVSGMVTVTVPDGKGEKKIRFSLEAGEIILSENLSGKAFFAKFTRK